MNRLADFNQICMEITLGHDKVLIRFVLIFKATTGFIVPKLSQKCLSGCYLNNYFTGMLPKLHVYIIGA